MSVCLQFIASQQRKVTVFKEAIKCEIELVEEVTAVDRNYAAAIVYIRTCVDIPHENVISENFKILS